MNGFQRTVKYVAMALGLCLALSIILAIAGGVSALFGVVGWWQEGEMGTVNFSQEYAGVLNIDIDNDMGALTIRQGDVFRVEAYDCLLYTSFHSGKHYHRRGSRSWRLA